MSKIESLMEKYGLDPIAVRNSEDKGFTVWVCTLGCLGGHGAPDGDYSGVCGSCGMSTARPFREVISV